MRITFEVATGGSAGRKIHLQPGQTAQFGRTEWADFSFPDDRQMSEVHFAVEHRTGVWHLRDLNSASGTKVNDDDATDCQLHTGDRIVAGSTELTVEIEGETARNGGESGDVKLAAEDSAPDSKPDATAGDAESGESEEDYLTPPESRTPSDLCEYLSLDDDDLIATAAANKGTPAFLKVLTDQAKYLPALRIQSHLLAKRKAIWWAQLCIAELLGDQLNEKEQKAMAAAKLWIVDPSDDNRRAAERTAIALTHTGPAAWLAMAVVWAGGSLAPVGNPVVKPDERLTGQALAAALSLAVIRKRPESPEVAAKRYQMILAKAKDVEAGKIELPAE